LTHQPQNNLDNTATVGRSPFVGRESELATLRSYFDSAMGGSGRIIMLAGEPGIGKTRTASELAKHAEGQGAQVLWGRCYEEEGAPAYWVWVQPIRAYLETTPPDQLRDELGDGALEISDIVSEVRELIPTGTETQIGQSPEQARFRLFDAVSSFLARVSERRPLMIVLDNLHSAHPSSLLMLEFLANTINDHRILIVGTYRDVDISRGHPLIHTLGGLNRLDHFERLLLRGLGSDDVAEYIGLVSRTKSDARLAEMVHLHTEGNPFFVTELVQLLHQEGALGGKASDVENLLRNRIPEGVREVIGRRLDKLTGACNQLLTIGSVIGREFSLEQLSALPAESLNGPSVSVDPSEILDLLDEAIETRLIEEVDHASGKFRFVHSLIQQTLAGEVSTTQTIRLHAKIAETFELLYRDRTGNHLGELVHHFSEAEALLGNEKLVNYLILAGEQALDTYAYDEALDYFQRALDAAGVTQTDQEEAAILFGLGRAQVATAQRHEMQSAVETLTRAFDYYEKIGDVDTALSVAEYPVMAITGITGLTHLISRALALTEPDSHRAGRLLGRYVRAVALERGDYGQATNAFHRAVEIARRDGDLTLEAHAFAEAGSVDGYYLNMAQGLEKCLHAIDLATQQEKPDLESIALNWAATILLVTGEPVRARYYAEACLANAEKLRDNYRIAGAIDNLEDLARLEGDWDLARELSDYGLDTAPRDGRLLAFRAVLEYEAGAYERGAQFVSQLIEVIERPEIGPTLLNACTALCLPIVMDIADTKEYADVARVAAERVVGSPEATPGVILSAQVGQALTAVSDGNHAAAQTLYDELLPRSGIMVYGGITAVDRVLGLLAGFTGLRDDADKHFAAAAHLCQRAGYRPGYAWNAYTWAGVLANLSADGTKSTDVTNTDRERALALLDEALDISQELGMGPLTKKAAAMQGSIKAQLAHVVEYPDGLTRREIEVLRVLARGKSNPQIGEELFISLNTVTRHLSHVYMKTGAANRAEAAVYAAKHDLV
jgi:DNA-binding CsgD family transcriptional regulator/DNA polymerase III delta prime subunit